MDLVGAQHLYGMQYPAVHDESVRCESVCQRVIPSPRGCAAAVEGGAVPDSVAVAHPLKLYGLFYRRATVGQRHCLLAGV